MGPQRMFGMTPWVRRLFVANLVVFLFQMTIFVDSRLLTTFGFVPLRALAQPWTFLTYMFLHGGPLHLAFNLLALYVFGPEVEERMGGGIPLSEGRRLAPLPGRAAPAARGATERAGPPGPGGPGRGCRPQAAPPAARCRPGGDRPGARQDLGARYREPHPC